MKYLILIAALLSPSAHASSSAIQTGYGGGASATASIIKTANYTILATDFGSGLNLLAECNCSSDCTMTLPAASNTCQEG